MFLSNSGLLMIYILQSTRNSPLTACLPSKLLLNRTGSFFSSIISGNMANLQNPYNDTLIPTFLLIPSAHFVVLPIIIFTITMAAMDSTSAKSMDKPLLLAKSLPLRFVLSALTVDILWFPKKTVNSSAFINASTLNVPFINTISPRWIRNI